MTKWVEVQTVSYKTHLIEVQDEVDTNSDEFWSDFDGCCSCDYEEADVVGTVAEDAVESARRHVDFVYYL